MFSVTLYHVALVQTNISENVPFREPYVDRFPQFYYHGYIVTQTLHRGEILMVEEHCQPWIVSLYGESVWQCFHGNTTVETYWPKDPLKMEMIHSLKRRFELVLHGTKSQKTPLIDTALKASQKTVFFLPLILWNLFMFSVTVLMSFKFGHHMDITYLVT
jgi:hypothetical protein